MGLQMKEFKVTKRAFNLLGNLLLNCRLVSRAKTVFTKLRDCGNTDRDIETKMYAYKQIGYCY